MKCFVYKFTKMKCIFCSKGVPKNAKFCPFCAARQICKECGETLIKNANVCIDCGTSISPNQMNSGVNSGVNTIEFKETSKERNFKASFTDTVGKNVSEALNNLIQGRIGFGTQPLAESDFNHDEVKKQSTEDASYEEISSYSEVSQLSQPAQGNDNASLKSFFSESESGKLLLKQTDLKADSKLDYAKKLALLVVGYYGLNNETTNRKTINLLINQAKVKSNTFITWLSNSDLFTRDGKEFSLSMPGQIKADKYVETILDENQSGKWKLGQSSRSSSSSKSSSGQKSNSSKPNFVTSLNFNPSKKDSLFDFAAKYNVKPGPQYILLVVSYMQEVLNVDRIQYDHIYTGLKHLKQRIPSNIQITVNQVKSRNGFLEGGNKDGFKTTVVGDNYLEHTMKIS